MTEAVLASCAYGPKISTLVAFRLIVFRELAMT